MHTIKPIKFRFKFLNFCSTFFLSYQCWCGNSYGSQGIDSCGCTEACFGDSSEICGSGCHSSIYQTNCDGSACGKINIFSILFIIFIQYILMEVNFDQLTMLKKQNK